MYNKELHEIASDFYDKNHVNKQFFSYPKQMVDSVKDGKIIKGDQITFRINGEIRNELDRIAKEESISLSVLLNEIAYQVIRQNKRFKEELQAEKDNWLKNFDEQLEHEQKLIIEEERKSYESKFLRFF